MMNRYRILIIDDSPDNIQAVIRCYEELHPEYMLYQATSGQTAMELAATEEVDIIISDWEMPGMSGIELLEALKADPQTAHIPVIIVTGVMLSASDLNMALSTGAYDYLRKPVEHTELIARTNSAIQLIKMHRKELAVKNMELVEKTLLLKRNNQFNIEIACKLKQLESLIESPSEARSLIMEIFNDIENNANETNWQCVEKAFHNVHPEFSKRITHQHPCITPAELKHCILIRLGLSNKEMASVLYQNPGSIKVTRSRIRRKLGIGNEINLQSFLMTI